MGVLESTLSDTFDIRPLTLIFKVNQKNNTNYILVKINLFFFILFYSCYSNIVLYICIVKLFI